MRHQKKNEIGLTMSLKPNPDAYSPSHITELEIHNDGLEKSWGKGSGASRMRTSICPTGLNFGCLGLVYIFSEQKWVEVKELAQGLKCLYTASLGLTPGTTYIPLSTARNNPWAWPSVSQKAKEKFTEQKNFPQLCTMTWSKGHAPD